MFNWRKKSSDLTDQLGLIVRKSQQIDPEISQHLESIIRASGMSGELLRNDWPSRQSDLVRRSSLELANRWLAQQAPLPKAVAADYLKDLERTLEDLTIELSIDNSIHPYQLPLFSSIAELIHRKRDKFKLEEVIRLAEMGLTIVVGMRWFPNWSEKNIESLNNRLTFINTNALKLHQDSISSAVENDEIPLNAGFSFMLDQGHTGDGTLISTNKRLIFVFDRDYKKATRSFKLPSILTYSFTETSAVPVSKEMTIQFSNHNSIGSVKFYVGNLYAVELTHLFKTFLHLSDYS